MQFSLIRSYAKVNLTLNVIGKFKNKLHKIESLVSFLSLHDLIYLKPILSNCHNVYFKGKFSKGIKAKNTVQNLLDILDKKNFLKDQKFEIKIIKNIPQESGMGGGSMNAAFLIKYFLKKKFFKLEKNELSDLLKILGSDVILGINPKNTILFSNGKVKRINYKTNFYTLVVKPNFGCSTKSIYSKVRSFTKPAYNHANHSLFSSKNLINSQNQLEEVAFKRYPRLKNLKLFLSKLPNVLFVRMSGSGSSIVAYFQSKKAIKNATKEFKKKYANYWYIISKTI